jgi:hypothetical protein
VPGTVRRGECPYKTIFVRETSQMGEACLAHKRRQQAAALHIRFAAPDWCPDDEGNAKQRLSFPGAKSDHFAMPMAFAYASRTSWGWPAWKT